MNRKGDLFMLGLNMLFLVAIILIFWKLSVAFRMQNEAEGLGTRQTALLQTYATAEEMLLYLDTAATFAAYEAQAEMLEKGALDPASSACGSYAGYASWSSDGKDCTPTRTSIERRFASETLDLLRGMLPASFPGLANYATSVTRSGGMLVLRATTQDRIELPIVTAKGSVQAQAASAVQDERATNLRRGGFAKDATLPARIEPARRREARAGPIEGIVLFSTDAGVLAFTGEVTAHYYVASDGSITQLVPEAEKAFSCEQCGEAVMMAIQGWNDASYSAVVNLTADVAKRNSVAIGKIAYRHEITKEDADGYPSKQKLTADVVSRQNTPIEQEAEEPVTPKVTVAWPTAAMQITSCWGPRSSLSDFHDGIDMPGDGNPVFAYADGVVRDTCTEGGRSGCRGYGRYVILEHPSGVYTRYSHLSAVSVKRGESVTVGQQIGRIGNAGRSTGPHLDFKVYTSADFGADKAKNPLCFFPEETLQDIDQRMSGNCRYGAFSLSDPKIKKECAGVSFDGIGVQPDRGCFTGGQLVNVDAKGDARVTATLQRLQERDLIRSIQEEAQRQGVDPNLVIAIITIESGGEVDLVNSCGAVGIGQIKTDAATDIYERKNVFPRSANSACKCPGTCSFPGFTSCRAASVPACQGDVRLDPNLGVRGLTAYYALQKTYLEAKGHHGLTDMARLMVASYNQGAGAISIAINKAKARGIADPKWEDVVPYVNPEGQQYVQKVMQHYTALGGSTPTVFSDQICPDQDQLTVKELGRYSFSPSFTTRVSNLLEPMDALAQWARETLQECQGEGDNRACLGERKMEKPQGVEFVPCANIEGDAFVATRYREVLQDCSANRQDACWCSFDPNRQDVQVRLYGEQADVFVEGERRGERPTTLPQALFTRNAGDEPVLATISLEVEGGRQSIVTWQAVESEGHSDPGFEEEADEHEIDQGSFSGVPESQRDVNVFGVYKDGEKLVWVADPGDAQACGVYKTTHLVCARLEGQTYRASTGETERPVVKFSLELEDRHDPEPVPSGKATVPSYSGVSLGAIDVTFEPSASEDVSYYRIECSGIVTQEETIVLGRTLPPNDERIGDEISAKIECAGLSSASTVSVTPVDIGGNEGAPLLIQVREEGTVDGAVAATT